MEIFRLCGEVVITGVGGDCPVSDAVSVVESDSCEKSCESPIHCWRPCFP